MNASDQVAQLLQARVPLALLFDIAGYGPTPGELLLEAPSVLPRTNRPLRARDTSLHSLELTA